MLGRRIALLLALVGCSHPSPNREPSSPAALPRPWPTIDEVPALTRAYYQSLSVIHATIDHPDAPDTPLLASLRPCQIEAPRRLDHPSFRKFFPRLRFFASSCTDGSYAVVSIDERRTVRLVSLQPEQRLPAPAWDQTTNGPVAIDSLDDVRLFASGFGLLRYLQTAAPADLEVRESSGTGHFAGMYYYEAHAPTYEVAIVSEDKRHYSVATYGRL